MRPIGFSTGALAYADFRQALEMLKGTRCNSIELSALRQRELIPLVESIDTLDLSSFEYVAIHAPSEFGADTELAIRDRLQGIAWRQWQIIVHPDAIHDFAFWRDLGSLLCIENMDKRKPVGRTANELSLIFEKLPDATLCFDIGHARQCDPTMTEAYFILRNFGSKLRQIHISEVNSQSKHDCLSHGSILAFQQVAELIPETIPLILETPVIRSNIDVEIEKAMQAMSRVEVMVA
ncbi:MAG: hypothetical protein ACRD3F_10795 [Acidobacteriaceae bacterium]